MTRTPEEFIAQHTAEVEPLHRDIGLAYWEASLSGKSGDFDRVAELEKKSIEIYSRPHEYEEVKAFNNALNEIKDPLIARQIELLYRAYRGSQGDKNLLNKIVDAEMDLTREFNTFRANFRGEKRTNNELEEILRNTRDSDEAREAWEALKQVGALAAPRVVELVELRNQHAKSLDSPNFYLFSLELKELDLKKLFTLLDELKVQTDPLFDALKEEVDAQLATEFTITPNQLRPWHYRNPFFQDMPPSKDMDLDPIFADKNLESLTNRYYKGIGLEIDDLLKASDLYEREGKDQHAYCIGIECPADVRVLCNIKPTARWMSTMLHEFGHAVYDRHVDPNLPFLLREPAHTLTTEAIAMLNERFFQSAEFLSGIADVPHDEALAIEAKLKRHQRQKLLVFVRWVLVMTNFERAMYENPAQDLNALWWDLVAKYQGLDGSERRGQPDWASKIHLSCSPVYYQNYLLGEMNASQFLAVLRREAGADKKIIGNPKVGAFLSSKIFRPGATKPWNKRLALATGEPLNPAFFLADLREK